MTNNEKIARLLFFGCEFDEEVSSSDSRRRAYCRNKRLEKLIFSEDSSSLKEIIKHLDELISTLSYLPYYKEDFNYICESIRTLKDKLMKDKQLLANFFPNELASILTYKILKKEDSNSILKYISSLNDDVKNKILESLTAKNITFQNLDIREVITDIKDSLLERNICVNVPINFNVNEFIECFSAGFGTLFFKINLPVNTYWENCECLFNWMEHNLPAKMINIIISELEKDEKFLKEVEKLKEII